MTYRREGYRLVKLQAKIEIADRFRDACIKMGISQAEAMSLFMDEWSKEIMEATGGGPSGDGEEPREEGERTEEDQSTEAPQQTAGHRGKAP